MALKKEIQQENGIITSYHRVLSIDSVINSHTSISVLSYIDEKSRKSEFDGKRPYKTAITYSTEYVQNMTVEMAYEYLKKLEEFAGAEDVFEEEIKKIERM